MRIDYLGGTALRKKIDLGREKSLSRHNLGMTISRGLKRDNYHASCTDLVVDIFHGLLSRVRNACVAVAQASCEVSGVCALPIQIAAQFVWSIRTASKYVRSRPPGILDLWRDAPTSGRDATQNPHAYAAPIWKASSSPERLPAFVRVLTAKQFLPAAEARKGRGWHFSILQSTETLIPRADHAAGTGSGTSSSLAIQSLK